MGFSIAKHLHHRYSLSLSLSLSLSWVRYPEVSDRAVERLHGARAAIVADLVETENAHRQLREFNMSTWKELTKEQKEAAVQLGCVHATMTF